MSSQESRGFSHERFKDTVKEKSYEFSDLEWRNDDIKHFGMVYFKDKESAQYIIDNFKEELMEYWL